MALFGKIILIIAFFFRLLKEGFGNPFRKVEYNKGLTIKILANGPSLKVDLKEIVRSHGDNNCEYFAMNDFVNDDSFTLLTPRYYVLSDPMFFVDTKRKERGIGIMNALQERVKWPMYLFVSMYFKKSDYLKIVRENPYVEVVFFHEADFPPYEGLEKMRNYIYKKGYGNGEYGTVVLHAIYISLTLRAKNIELYGVDHSYFNGLCVNDENIPCYIYKHSYDEETKLTPIEYHYDNSMAYYDMSRYLSGIAMIFRGHKFMASYARYMGANVLNCTKDSLIDAYPRRKEGTKTSIETKQGL